VFRSPYAHLCALQVVLLSMLRSQRRIRPASRFMCCLIADWCAIRSVRLTLNCSRINQMPSFEGWLSVGSGSCGARTPMSTLLNGGTRPGVGFSDSLVCTMCLYSV
jgi:hypothetical protein